MCDSILKIVRNYFYEACVIFLTWRVWVSLVFHRFRNHITRDHDGSSAPRSEKSLELLRQWVSKGSDDVRTTCTSKLMNECLRNGETMFQTPHSKLSIYLFACTSCRTHLQTHNPFIIWSKCAPLSWASSSSLCWQCEKAGGCGKTGSSLKPFSPCWTNHLSLHSGCIGQLDLPLLCL